MSRRKRPGPAPGTGGRPLTSRGPAVGKLTLRLYEVDSARIARLRELWGLADSDVVRRAIELADAAPNV